MVEFPSGQRQDGYFQGVQFLVCDAWSPSKGKPEFGIKVILFQSLSVRPIRPLG